MKYEILLDDEIVCKLEQYKDYLNRDKPADDEFEATFESAAYVLITRGLEIVQERVNGIDA